MKTKSIFFIICLSLIAYSLEATTGKYRLTLRDNPSTTIVIGWDQVSGSNPTVYYGTTDYGTNWSSYPNSKTPSRVISYKGMNNNFARLTGLQPNTNYYFVIKDSQGTSSRYWFKTCPDDPNERLSFLAGGDSRNNYTPRQNANKLVAKLKPTAVMFGGDMTSSGTDSQWQDWFDHWQLTIASDGRMFPIVAARGNHESSNSIIDNLFDVPNSNVYYAITFGGSLIRSYTLNTETSISGSQTSWLVSDLQSSNTTWKTAQYHKPMRPHVSSKSEGNSQYSNWAQPFYDYGVRLVVECDAHTVKTTWPVQPSTGGGSDEGFVREDDNGTIYAGEGCWGAPLRTNDDNKNWTRNSGKFNQFKWIFVDQSKIEVRTVKVDNADQVGEVSNNNPFTIPSNLDIWNPSNGSVVTILNQSVIAPTVSITAPSNGTHYSTPQSVTITATAADGDGSVTGVEFFQNGNLIGTDNTSPYSINWTIPADGAYNLTAEATDNDNNTTTSTSVGITVGVTNESTSSRINSGDDDVEEGESGAMYMNSSDIELVYDSYNSNGNQKVGLLFRNLGIPQGATITSAYIQFTTDETNSASCNLTIRGHDADNASDFSTSSNNVSNRTTTNASVAWTPSAWNSVGAAGSAQKTPELKSVVQEIVDRSGWTTASKLVMIITGSGKRTAESFNGSSSSAPIIYVDYVVGGGTPANNAPSVNITNPSNGTDYDNLASINISANASDSDGSVTSVEFFQNGNSIGIDNTSPYSVNWTIPTWGSYNLTAVATDDDNANTTSSIIGISATDPEVTPQTINVKISNGDDDVEQNGVNGSMYMNSSDIELVADGSRGDQIIGLRFRNIDIPQGATINNAYIQFTVDETNSGSCNLTIKGQDVDDASAFSTSTNNVSNRTTTSASKSWSPSSWNSVGAAGNDQATPNISNIIQEIVDRSGWSNNNDMVIIITGSGERTAESYNGSSSKAARLIVEYTDGSSSSRLMNNNPVNIAEHDEHIEDVKIYPNPFMETINVRIDKANVAGTIEIYDLKGSLIKTALIKEGNHSLTIGTGDLRSGVYLLNIKSENNSSVVHKLFKE